MASYNLMKAADRDRLRSDRSSEKAALDAGNWPRDLSDKMRWSSQAAAEACCQADLAYLKDLETRLEAGDEDLAGWEK